MRKHARRAAAVLAVGQFTGTVGGRSDSGSSTKSSSSRNAGGQASKAFGADWYVLDTSENKFTARPSRAATVATDTMLSLLPSGRTRIAVAATAVCVAALAGCSNGGTGSSTTSTPSPSTAPSPSGTGEALITIKDFTFRPKQLTVAAGTKVTVINIDAAAHTVTNTGSKAFDTGDVAAGRTITFTAPDKAGAYPFICTLHPYMKGSLTVR
ncbi:cupredoxin domain-containing protein [Streptomyces sp. NPDC005231]|uniref:cupredoxin domain-containing protein n=1 Tax=Streptomyces sp. NPDC005231 TaxID=3157026 RepID=UPI0033B4DABF